jgi:hypothetical protein
MLSEMKKEFVMPSTEYRGAPFWSWNDLLEENEIRRQIREMKKVGLGGFFMHSRGGLETPFNGEEWFKIVDAAVDEARKQGMYAWAYDEDRWPSGHAGGLTADIEPEAQMWKLVGEEVDSYPSMDGGVKAVFVKQGGQYVPAKPGAKGKVLIFRALLAKSSPWYNDREPLDTLSAKAVDAFIEVAYKPYAERYKPAIKAGILPGVFTDEPNFHPGRAGSNWFSWTPALPEEFKKRRGYDLLTVLPALICGMESPDSAHPTDEVRHDYYQTLAELFEENFSKRIGDFCDKNGLALTGHYLCEQPMKDQVLVGGSCMPNYIHEGVPGIDILCRRTFEIITVKQTSSVCHQWGKKKLISELYGASGWDLSITDQKKIGDWQYALGVNFRCQHLALYTMRGERKRDFPPSGYIQQPWWKHWRLLEDYFGRLSLALRTGTVVREVAMIHPVESVWAVIDGKTGLEKVGKLDEALYNLADAMLYKQVDFDFIDESLLERFGGASKGRLRMNKADYRVVVVPQMTHMRPTTAYVLLTVAKGGGKVFSKVKNVKVYAGKVDRGHCKQLEKEVNKLLAKSYVEDNAKLAELLKQNSEEPVILKGTAKVLYQLRAQGKERLLFLTNQTEEEAAVTVEVTGGGTPMYWDLETGKCIPLAAEAAGKGRMSFKLFLPSVGSALISYNVGESLKAPKPAPEARAASPKAVALPQSTTFKLSNPNVLYLDKAEISVEGVDLKVNGFVPQIGRSIKQVYNLPAGRYGEVQPWLWRKQSTGKKVTLVYTFNVDKAPASPVKLALERVARKTILVNGKKVSSKAKGFFLDKAIQVIDLPKLRKGRNTITLTELLDESFEAEAIYVLGKFGVKNNRIVAMPQTISPADWTKSGLPFYAGSVTLDVPVTVPKAGRYWLDVDAQCVSVVGAAAGNGKPALRAFPPFRYTLNLPKGKSTVKVELTNSLRNLMGPHHFKDERPMWVGPGEMGPENPVDRYVHIPSGITKVRISEATL